MSRKILKVAIALILVALLWKVMMGGGDDVEIED